MDDDEIRKTREHYRELDRQVNELDPQAWPRMNAAIEAVEQEDPQARDRNAIAEEVSGILISALRKAGKLNHPESDYQRRIQKMAHAMDEPVLLKLVIPEFLTVFLTSPGDPLTELDELTAVMGFSNLHPMPAR